MDTDRLKQLHGDLVDELLDQVDRDADREAQLREAWNDATDADRTAQSFQDWLEEYAVQIAAAWVVTAVFVRFLEDNELLDDHYIAGPTPEDREEADETLRWFRREHSTASETDYLEWVFGQLADLKAGGVFSEERNPLFRWALPADAGRQLLEALRET
ncbi:MAG: SAM-dependent methyltransferase, partial [Bradymonadaceae bacterium]